MTLNFNRNLFRWILIISSFVIITLILWNTYSFFQKFKEEERAKMETWSIAQIDLNSNNDLNANINQVTSHVITETILSTPVLVLNDKQNLYSSQNISEALLQDSASVQKLIVKFSSENQPIPVLVDGKVSLMIYYGNSPILNKLKYYPLFLLLIIVLFAAVVFFFYKSTKNAEQNRLWTGMAKETAHQIGTPLSSLVGWTEILKSENVNPEYITEIEKDINRLQTITDRFSKIGSIPILENLDVVELTKNSYEYIKARSSKLIDFSFSAPEESLHAHVNPQLFSWTIENLVKNAIDAMKGKGALNISIEKTSNIVLVNISDTGKGISKSNFKKIFEPGYTTKARGWGLGLSLSKRIIEDYHQGKIRVLKSEIGVGSTLQIALRLQG
ncbi:sensor histidine kinase [Winogradskyella aurantiaca]|uniref:sensor histidine kinase n=1 Tax=Winogradskyella aurantiaca TaxID=2219558 RepID=UPI000E1CCD85|nr:HAMP domain-containing sensor histidine kinase [Winogradskyella aurantiaca]